MAERLLSGVIRVGGLATFTGVFVNTCLYNVDGGHRAVMFDRFQGLLPDVIPEGTHFMVPFLHTPRIMDVRTRARSINSVAGTHDLQHVNISLRILSRPIISSLPTIINEIGPDYDARVFPNIGPEVIKAVVAEYQAEELLTKREEVSAKIRRSLLNRIKKYNITLDDVSITHLTFGAEYTKAIEMKQVEEQKAERQTYIVEKADQERQASVIRAEGESEAARIINEALKSNGEGLIAVRRIDAAKAIAKTLGNSRNVTYLPGGSNGQNLLLGLNSN